MYTTPQATFDVLVSFAPRRTYDVGVWKQKAIVESRGLVANDDVVAVSGWYAYYLIRNRTHYGKMLTVNLNNTGGVKRNGEHLSNDYLIFSMIGDQGSPIRDLIRKEIYDGLQQLDDLRVRLTYKSGINQTTIDHSALTSINAKIRQAHIFKSSYGLYSDITILLDEYGRVWQYTFGTIEQLVMPDYVVEIQMDLEGVFTLTRDGKLNKTKYNYRQRADGEWEVYYSNLEIKMDYNGVKVVALIKGQYNVYEGIVTSSGLIGTYDAVDDSFAAIERFAEGGVRYLSDMVTSRLSERDQPNRSTNLKVIRNTDTSVMTVDRTVYNIHYTGKTIGNMIHPKEDFIKPKEIVTTRHRAQTLQEYGEHTKWWCLCVMVDPSH